jgi:ribosome-associated protein
MTQIARRFSLLPALEKAAIVAQWLDEHKAHDIVTLDLAGKAPLTDVALIATVSSVRQGQSLADGVLALCKEQNFEFFHVEGQTTGQWILVDLNDVVVHLFMAEARELYNIEALWRTASPATPSSAPDDTL